VIRLARLALVLALGASAACSGSDDATVSASAEAVTSWSTSYASLADTRTTKALETFRTAIGAFSAATLPHQAKALRKQVGELRDYVDLFAYAYDKKGPGDPWVDLRNDLDVGYETIGAFKDLFDTQGLTLATKDPQTGAWSEGVRPDQITYADARDLDKRSTGWRRRARRRTSKTRSPTSGRISAAGRRTSTPPTGSRI
jgi:hypothetical protein